MKEDSILICDTFELSDKTKEITERMVSWTKPEICDGYVDLKSARIIFDSDKCTVEISDEVYRNHADTEDVTAYLLDFRGINSEKFEVEIVLNEKVV